MKVLTDIPDDDFFATNANVHIERLRDDVIWIGIGDRTFYFKSRGKIKWIDEGVPVPVKGMKP